MALSIYLMMVWIYSFMICFDYISNGRRFRASRFNTIFHSEPILGYYKSFHLEIKSSEIIVVQASWFYSIIVSHSQEVGLLSRICCEPNWLSALWVLIRKISITVFMHCCKRLDSACDIYDVELAKRKAAEAKIDLWRNTNFDRYLFNSLIKISPS